MAEPDVLGHGELGQDGELLVHRGDAGGCGVGGRREAHGAPVEANLACARSGDPGQQVQQRRLARAVGPEQGMDLAGTRHEVDALQRPDRAVTLAEPFQREQRRAARARGGRLALVRSFDQRAARP
jgi:hypothetical protein